MKIGWLGKKWGPTLLDRIISVFGCLKPVRDSYFQFRLAIFQFSRALTYMYIFWLSAAVVTAVLTLIHLLSADLALRVVKVEG